MSRNSVFLSSGDRDLRVAFKVNPGSQASSRVEAKNSALLSSFDGYLLDPIEWPNWSQASCGVLRGDSGLLSRPCRKKRASSRDEGESCGFSRAAGDVWCFSRVMSGSSGSLSCGPREVQSPFDLRGGARHFSRVMAGESGLKMR